MDDMQILDVWGAGRRHPAARPLLLLAAARPDLTPEDLTTLPVGRRNHLLLHDRQATFGDRIDGDVLCPRCGERLEVGLPLAELIGASPGGLAADAGIGEVVAGDVVLRFRLPTAA